MDERHSREEFIAMVRMGFREIGYQPHLLVEDYPFTEIDTIGRDVEHRIDLAAFALEPVSYRNACFGAVVARLDGAESIARYRSLGAPQILALDPETTTLREWKMVAHGKPELLQVRDHVTPDQILSIIVDHQAEWNPGQVLRAKSIGFRPGPFQRSIFDTGLIPALDEMVHQKLDELLNIVIAASKGVWMETHDEEPDYVALFRLIFRLLTAKLLVDRRYPGAQAWPTLDAQAVIAAVEANYFQKSTLGPVLDDRAVQDVAWRSLLEGFSLANVSMQAFAYVFETTLVSKETRRRYHTHATPSAIAEYIVNNLPLDTLPKDERYIFEPFAGHAPFLVAALDRLRSLLPTTVSKVERHAYLVQMLSAFELDPFAQDVALVSVMFADYPNPNGWRIVHGDAFSSPEFDSLLAQARVVIGNPPFGAFSEEERQAYPSVRAAYKEVEALRRVIAHSPQMLGFVLPRTFIDGKSFREARQTIDKEYDDVTVIELPAGIFRHSETEPVLLLAHGRRGVYPQRRSARVTKDDYPRFIQTGQTSDLVEWEPDPVHQGAVGTLWRTPYLSRVWEAFDGLPRLGDITEISRGMEFKGKISAFVSDTPRPGFVPGLRKVQPYLEPYVIRSHSYISNNPDDQKGNGYLLPWDQPKVLANAARISRGPWRIAASVDNQGLVATQRFHGIWPSTALPLEVVEAILNGPVANAFLSTHTSGRDNTIDLLQHIPVPVLTPAQVDTIVSHVHEYRSYRSQWLKDPIDATQFEHRCQELVWQIDADLLTAYDLSPRLERELLTYFASHKRPGPVLFDRYYPVDFRPAIPWRVYISSEFRGSAARQTLERLPVLRDPILSEVVSELDE